VEKFPYVYFRRQVIGQGKARQGTLDPLEYPSQKKRRGLDECYAISIL